MMFAATIMFYIMIIGASASIPEDIKEDIKCDVKLANYKIPKIRPEPLTIFVGKLKCDMSEEEKEELSRYFRKFGEVIDLSIPSNAIDKTKNDGYCFITYADVKIANKVLNVEHIVNEKTLYVQQYGGAKPMPYNTFCTVFVENLGDDMKKEELSEYFGKFGEMNNLAVPLNFKSGKNMGYCFITYTNVKVANEILGSSHTIRGRILNVKPYDNNNPRYHNTPYTVFVGNLNLDMTEGEKKELLEHFSKFGRVINMAIQPNITDRRKNRGCCFITYADIEAADKALKASHITKDRVLRVETLDKTKFKTRDMPCMVFVRNLKRGMSEKELLEHFRRFGEVCNLFMPPNVAYKMKNINYCFVAYSNMEAADRALEAVHVVKGWTLDVRPYGNTKLKAYNILCMIYVRNLDPNTKKDEVLEYFGKFGRISSLSMPFDPTDKTKNNGNCFITYVDAESANKALEAVHTFNNRSLGVMRCNRDRLAGHNELCTVFVKNLRSDVTEDDLIDYFSVFGEMIDISMPLSALDNMKNIGVCFITYVDIEAADKALKAKHTLKGRILCLQPYDKNNGRGYKRPSEEFCEEDNYGTSKQRRI